MSGVYVIGADMIRFGRFPERSVPELAAEAALLALDDCGLGIRDMQALWCGNLYQASAMVGQRLLREIGMTGIPVVNVANACATGATAFREAWLALRAGVCELVTVPLNQYHRKSGKLHVIKPLAGRTQLAADGQVSGAA